jgi:hypothetical protein
MVGRVRVRLSSQYRDLPLRPLATVMISVLGADSRVSAQGIGEVTSSAALDSAFAWLCERRADYADYADSADVWNVRRRWPDLKLQLQDLLLRASVVSCLCGESTPMASSLSCGRPSTHWC